MNRTVPAAVVAALLASALSLYATSMKLGENEGRVLRIADFEDREERNDYDNGYFGAWEKDPDDPTQGCRLSFVEEGQGIGYYCIRLDYDVDSDAPAYNGFWMLFVDLDLRDYDKVCFWVKGEGTNFTERFIVELKSENETGRAPCRGVTNDWTLVEIPLAKFSAVKDWSMMTEFVIVFDEKYVTKKHGSILVDNIYFSKGKLAGTLDMEDTRMTREEASRARTSKPTESRRRSGGNAGKTSSD